MTTNRRPTTKNLSNGFGKRDSGLSDRKVRGGQTEAGSVPEAGCGYGAGQGGCGEDQRSRVCTSSAASGGRKLIGGQRCGDGVPGWYVRERRGKILTGTTLTGFMSSGTGIREEVCLFYLSQSELVIR